MWCSTSYLTKKKFKAQLGTFIKSRQRQIIKYMWRSHSIYCKLFPRWVAMTLANHFLAGNSELLLEVVPQPTPNLAFRRKGIISKCVTIQWIRWFSISFKKNPKPNNSPCAAAQILTLLNHFKYDAMLSLYSSFMPPHRGRVVVCPWLALKFSLRNINQGELVWSYSKEVTWRCLVRMLAVEEAKEGVGGTVVESVGWLVLWFVSILGLEISAGIRRELIFPLLHWWEENPH